MWQRRDLWQEMDALRREIDRVFSDFWPGMRAWRSPWMAPLAGRTYPLVNLREGRDEYQLDAMIPGLDKDDLEVTTSGRTLTISGKRAGLPEDENITVHRNERGSGRFVRTLELATDIDERNVKAEYKNGILHVTLPKAEYARPRQISVSVQ